MSRVINVRPASLLPFEVVEDRRYAYIYPRFALDPTKRAGLPLRAVALARQKTGAKRGESPQWLGFEPGARQDLDYLNHAANAYPRLVEKLAALREEMRDWQEALGGEREGLDDLCASADALLAELGERS